jgi:hypothetical protein
MSTKNTSSRLWCGHLLALVCWAISATPAHAQSAFTPFPSREIGLQSVVINRTQDRVTGSTSLALNSISTALGASAFYLKRNEKSSFWRASLGFSGINRSLIQTVTEDSVVRNTSNNLHEFHTQLSFAVGKEIPQIQRRFLNRLRLRTGIQLFTDFTLSSKAVKVLQETNLSGSNNIASAEKDRVNYANTNALLVFFQSEFRLAKQLYVGLEWSFGPYLTIDSHTTDRINALPQPNTSQQTIDTKVFFPVALSRNGITIGYSF